MIHKLQAKRDFLDAFDHLNLAISYDFIRGNPTTYHLNWEPPDFASMKSMGADEYVAWGVVIILNAVIMGLETDSESAIFEWTEQVGLVLWSVGP